LLEIGAVVKLAEEADPLSGGIVGGAAEAILSATTAGEPQLVQNFAFGPSAFPQLRQ
jgi:hypothetical protein